MSSALRPASTGTLVSTAELAGWQPEQAAAPTGGSGVPAAAVVIDTRTAAAGTKAQSKFMDNFTKRAGGLAPPPLCRHVSCILWFLSGNERIRSPVALKKALSTAGAATQIVGSPTPPQKPPLGIMMVSTVGICAIRIES
jgi:hypothetical protein